MRGNSGSAGRDDILVSTDYEMVKGKERKLFEGGKLGDSFLVARTRIALRSLDG